MEEMDNSILSIASIASEVAGGEDVVAAKDQEEAVAASDAPVTAPQESIALDEVALDDIAPPTLMEEVGKWSNSRMENIDLPLKLDFFSLNGPKKGYNTTEEPCFHC